MPETALQRYIVDGGVMMVFLVPLALLMIAFAVQGLINLRRARVCPRRYAARAAELVRGGVSSAQAADRLAAEGHSLARVLSRVLRHLEFKADADPAGVLQEEIEEECEALRQRNSQLALVYTVAPLMGLLGTVFGMVGTFGEFTRAADPSVRDLSAGINVALITTAWGLSIAIPAFITLYHFARVINTYERVILPEEGARALHAVLDALRAPAPAAAEEG